MFGIMVTHQIAAFASSLSAKLATRSRHVCMFLGAGSSKACGLPDVAALTAEVLAGLEGDQLESFNRITAKRNLEQALSRLRRIHAVVEGDEIIDGLRGDDARKLDAEVCHLIIRALTKTKADETPVQNLASWVARADYERPVEIFTVNYDLLIEMALEKQSIPYFDGFFGALTGRFRADFVEGSHGHTDTEMPEFFARLWKLHGSVNWAWDDSEGSGSVVRIGNPVSDQQIAAIFPSDAKYEESRRMPFVVLQDRLRRALNEPESLFLFSGYSWADDHLNELIFDAAARRPRSEFIAFCYSEIPQILADQAVRTPNLQVVTRQEAIIGGVRSGWDNATQAVTLPIDIWNEDSCGLGDFKNLTSFLSRSSTTSGGQHPLEALGDG